VLVAFVYIGERNFDAAERFLAAVNEDLARIRSMPGMGAMREFDDPRLRDLRSLPVSGFRNYLIFYRVSADRVEFLRLIHGARDLETALLEA
jgi:toxin ParE1/3/4